MSDRNSNRQENRSNQSGEGNLAADAQEANFGAGGQGDQNIGHQQQQQHDVDRDAKLRASGDSARTDR